MRRYGGRRFGGGRFSRGVRTVVSKMNGLKVFTQNNNQSITSIPSFTTVGLVTLASNTKVFTVAAPADLIPFTVGAPVATNDAKCYLRQSKKDYFFRNGAGPCWLRLVSFRVRRNISITDFSSFLALLNTDTGIQATTWAAPLTTSNAAQRFLKFGKTKLVKMAQGATYHHKINVKFGSKLIDENLDANLLYLGTRITRGFICQLIPAPVLRVDNAATPTSYTGMAPTAYEMDILEQEYVSGYYLGNSDPNVVHTNMAAATGTFMNLMMPGYAKWVPQVN